MKSAFLITIFIFSLSQCSEYIPSFTKKESKKENIPEYAPMQKNDVTPEEVMAAELDRKGWLDWYSKEKTGNLYISNFTVEDIADNQNWDIEQDDNNVMLFANRRGILTFDGSEWDIVRPPSIPYSIKKDPFSGTIFVGCGQDFGRLVKDKYGQYHYISLSTELSSITDITEIKTSPEYVYFYCNQSVNRMSFDDPEDILQYGIDRNETYRGIIQFGDDIFVLKAGKGIKKVNFDEMFEISDEQTEIEVDTDTEMSMEDFLLQSIHTDDENDTTTYINFESGDFLLSENEIVFDIVFDKKHALIGTTGNKLFLFDGKELKPYEIADSEYLDESILYGGINLSKKEFAISTLTGGCIIISKKSGKTISTINYQTGLPDDEIYAIGKDINKGLWISHEFGLSRINLSIPIKNYNSYPGLEGNIFSVIDFDTTVYISTTEGVFYLDEIKDYKEIDTLVKVKRRVKKYKPVIVEEKVSQSKVIKPKEDTENEVVYQQPTEEEERKDSWLSKWKKRREEKKKKKDDEIIKENNEVSTPQFAIKDEIETRKVVKQKAYYKTQTRLVSKKVYAIQSIGNVFKKIPDFDEKCRHMVKFRDRLLVATNVGLFEIKDKSARLLVGGRYINCITQSENWRRFFIGTNTGVFAIYLHPETEKWEVEYNFDEINNSVYSIIECSNQVLWLGCENFALKTNIDSRAKPTHGEPYFFTNDFSERIIVRKINDQPYFLLPSYISVYDEKSESIVMFEQFDETYLNKIKYIYPQKNLTWIQRNDEWTYYGDTVYPNDKKLMYFNLFDNIQNIHVDNDDNAWIVDDKNAIFEVLTSKQSPRTSYTFNTYIKSIQNNYGKSFPLDGVTLNWNDYKDNSLIVKVASPFFIKQEATQYQYFLEGLSNKGSKWSEHSTFEFPWLPTGKHELRVRARNIFGKVSYEKTYNFTINPPYWKTMWFRVSIILTILFFGYSVFKIREKNHEREKRTLELKVAERTQELARQQQEIRDSIHYARRIQQAVLPSEEILNTTGIETFVLNKPRDIVSGDYYWFAEQNRQFVIAAADCTGHGVPGAFLSMLGISFLNEIVKNREITQADEILNNLREQVINSLHQKGRQREARDGMDIALCIIDLDELTLNYAGANNPLYLIRDNELYQVKADKMPISIYGKKTSHPFTNNEIQLEKGDVIYLFSDGYIDQFGGPEGRKFLAKRFRKLLIDIHQKPMKEQSEVLNATIENWRGAKPQIDDMLVLGLRI